jgi:hypothetical protein
MSDERGAMNEMQFTAPRSSLLLQKCVRKASYYAFAMQSNAEGRKKREVRSEKFLPSAF